LPVDKKEVIRLFTLIDCSNPFITIMEEQGYFDQGGAKMMELAPDSSIGDVLRRALSKETSARARWAQVENHFESAATPSAKVGQPSHWASISSSGAPVLPHRAGTVTCLPASR